MSKFHFLNILHFTFCEYVQLLVPVTSCSCLLYGLSEYQEVQESVFPKHIHISGENGSGITANIIFSFWLMVLFCLSVKNQ